MSFLCFQGIIFGCLIRVLGVEVQRIPLNVTKNSMNGSQKNILTLTGQYFVP